MKNKPFDRMLRIYTPNIKSGDLFENFILSAVVTIVAIRIFLFITGYPQVGDSTLHIAHMLWGGALMVVSIFLMFFFLNKEIKVLASVLAGIGFGTFIDELGKFITQDNDYFFQPTIAIIYIIFILIFFVVRFIEKSFNYKGEDYAANGLEYLRDLVVRDLDSAERRQAILWFEKSKNVVPFAKELIDIIENGQYQKGRNQDIITKTKAFFYKVYKKMVHSEHFVKIVIIIFVLVSIGNMVEAVFHLEGGLSVFEFIQLATVIASGGFVLVGTYFMLKDSKYTAYSLYRISILILILLNQIFLFYHYQLLAILSLGINLLIYLILRYMLEEEAALQKEKNKEFDEAKHIKSDIEGMKTDFRKRLVVE